MTLVQFTFTNEYDSQSQIRINPDFVERIRPNGKTKTDIFLVSKAQITVDGTMDEVTKKLDRTSEPDAVANVIDRSYDPPPEEATG